ncbi:MAG TPA: hypothetical protein VNS32_17130 [Flavisolibacter sp.]|nr:hypothetical protein [Flavisolibacter sp.]
MPIATGIPYFSTIGFINIDDQFPIQAPQHAGKKRRFAIAIIARNNGNILFIVYQKLD